MISLSPASTIKTAVTCANCNLDNLCIPKGLPRSEVGELGLLVSRNNMCQKGGAIYHAGSPFRGIIALRSGSVKLVSLDSEGNELVVDFILPGELLGFDGLANDRHNCTAIALETVNYCHLPAAKIEILATQTPGLSHVLLQRSCSQFDAQVQKMMLHRRSADARVACFILHISDRLKQRGYAEMEFRLSMSREEIGNYLGIAHETVSRIIHLFQDRDLIEIKSKQLKIKNKKELFDLFATTTPNSPSQGT
ncbi:MAG: helix-turn-helix domain-containing protein [Methylococcales bacterium]|nr:helix-turn-helix domain-containing protein [Methylococcales bacterium]